MKLKSELYNPKYIQIIPDYIIHRLIISNSKVKKKGKMVFSYLVWGGTRMYGGVDRKSLL